MAKTESLTDGVAVTWSIIAYNASLMDKILPDMVTNSAESYR